MAITETLAALGSWEIQLTEATPDHLLDQLGFFGHVAVADGIVDVEAVGDGLLSGARYVGVLRAKDKDTGRTLSGSGMVFWLGDEDGKGDILEAEVSLAAQTLTQCVAAIVGPSNAVTVGTVHSVAGTYTGTHQFQTRREALSIICDAFNVEFRVNGDGSVDVGTAAQLYNAESPDTIVVRKGAGADMDLVALGGDYTVDESVYDYSTRVVLLGQTIGTGDTPDEVFATGSADAPSVPYLNLRGNTVKMARTISESGTTAGSVAARAQLQLNRFNRVARALKVTAEEFETEGNFVVGDSVYVYDPDTGIVNTANEVTFRGEVLHPDVVRASGITWPVVQGMTVAFRTGAGVWLDLTPFVTWETGGNELTVGDLPKSLTKPTDNPVQVRLDAVRADASTPAAPTGLALTTSSALNSNGQTVAVIHASWTAPALNTDGSVITDLSHYVVRYRPQFRSPQWFQAPVTAATEIDLTATPSLPYDVQVAAVDLAGHTSDFTATSSITAAADALAPNPPADPVVTSYLGQLRIEYAGTDSTGNPMASDTNRIDVHVSATSGFTPSSATRVDSITPFAKGVSYATAPYGSLRYVKLVAVDHTGNPSAASAQVSGSTVQAGDGDIAALSVGKLTAGIMTADVTVSGRFATALTGARVEMNALGFQKFAADSSLLVSITGTEALLTGIYKTALTGRRIEIGSSGAIGDIWFYAPDGRRAGIRGFTGGTATLEALRMEIPRNGDALARTVAVQVQENDAVFLTGESIFPQYARGTGVGSFTVRERLNAVVDTDPQVYRDRLRVRNEGLYVFDPADDTITRFQVSTNDTWIRDPGDNGRMQVSPTGFRVWDSDGASRVQADDDDYTRLTAWNNKGVTLMEWDGTTRIDRFFYTGTEFFMKYPGTNQRVVVNNDTADNKFSPLLGLINHSNHGINMYYYNDSPGVNGRLVVGDVGRTTYMPIWASSFVVSSSQAGKDDVRDLAVGALAKLRALRVVDFTRKPPTPGRPARGTDGGDADERPVVPVAGVGRRELGVIAEQVADVAPELVVHGETPMIDMGSELALVIASVQELAAAFDDFQKGDAP